MLTATNKTFVQCKKAFRKELLVGGRQVIQRTVNPCFGNVGSNPTLPAFLRGNGEIGITAVLQVAIEGSSPSFSKIILVRYI